MHPWTIGTSQASGSSPFRRMTLEMADIVLESLADHIEIPEYRSTLASVCRVSKAMDNRARPRLYRKIPFLTHYPRSEDISLLDRSVHAAPNFQRDPPSILLLDTLDKNPALASYVKIYTLQRLAYVGSANLHIGTFYARLQYALSNMKNLRELTITAEDFPALLSDELFNKPELYAPKHGFSLKTDIKKHVKPDLFSLCCNVDHDFTKPGPETDLMDAFIPFMTMALSVIPPGLVKLTVNDVFTPRGYILDLFLLKHPNIQSLTFKYHDGFPYLTNGPDDMFPPRLAVHMIPNLETFEGSLQSFFRLMYRQRKLKDVRITKTDCDLGRGSDIGQRMRHQITAAADIGMTAIGLRTIERLEFSDNLAQGFAFTDGSGGDEPWEDGIFCHLVSLHTLVLPASFSFKEEVVMELSKLPELTHLIIGAANKPSEFCNCVKLNHQSASWPWCDIELENPEPRDSLVESLFNKCPKLQTLEVKQHMRLDYNPDPQGFVSRGCRVHLFQTGRLVYVAPGVIKERMSIFPS